MWAWGLNSSGQLGLANTTNYSSPKQVGSNTWKVIAGGDAFTIGITTSGALFSWGTQSQGQLGLNTTSGTYNSPKQIGALTTWLTVSSGQYMTQALKTDGTLWFWGDGRFYGQSGLGFLGSVSSPIMVGGVNTWKSVSVNYFHVAAIQTNGTLWTWGFGGFGEGGRGVTGNTSSPQQVGSLTNWAQVASGRDHIIAVKTDGTLWSFGYGYGGVLGLGNTTSYSSPKQVGALTTWKAVAASSNGYNSYATTGTALYAWGNNGNSVLGIGNATSYSSPKQVGSATQWIGVSAGPNSAAGIHI